MKFAIAVHGTRGDVEPAAAVALELRRRGHDIAFAAPPNLIEFVESTGLAPVTAYGPDSQQQLEAEIFKDWYKVRNPATVLRQAREYVVDGWAEMSAALTELSAGADLILTGTTYQEVAANVAEFQGIPLAALHYFPARANNKILPIPVPMFITRPAWAIAEWAHWRILKPAEDAQRAQLGLAPATTRAVARIVAHDTLEIQAYDEAFFPGLTDQWERQRPLIGSLTLQRQTDLDMSVESWIAEDKPPIYFGFGSMPVADPIAAVAMITDVVASLGERALICSGVLDVEIPPVTDQVMVVPVINHAAVFPRCRAIVHHGGAGTTSASVRSGVPTLVLWVGADQPVWAAQVKRLGVGTSRRFSKSTPDSLRRDLQTVLSRRCVDQSRQVAARMISAETSLARAADLLESAAARAHR